MSGRILIVEDESLIAESIAFALEQEGFRALSVRDGRAALEAAEDDDFDLALLDLALPGDLSGMDVCRELRARSTIPIIIVTARDTELDRVLGLERGADDYVVKPFSLPELIARVRAQLRRRELDMLASAQQQRRVGGIGIDLARHEVEVDGRPVQLTPSEFKILALLSERPGHVYDRREIVAHLWSSSFVGDMRACDAHIARLRRKLDPRRPRPPRLVTVRGIGYKLEPV